MTDAPDTHDDRAPEGGGSSETETTSKLAEPAEGSNGATAHPEGSTSEQAPEAEAAPQEAAPAADAPQAESAPEPQAESAPEPEGEAKPAEEAPRPERPAIGPVIIAEAPPPGSEETTPSRRQRAGGRHDGDKPRRRRRRSAAERHRGVFFARLSELRRSERQAAAANASDGEPPESPEEAAAAAQEAAAAESQAAEEAAAAAEGEAQPAAEEQQQPQPQAEGGQRQQGQGRSAPPPPVSRPRLISAIDRVGGPEVVQEALAPKQDEEGERLKWAQVCSDSARGLQPGDPAFAAWVRLAATPVREVRSAVNDMLGIVDEPRHRRGGGRRGRRERPGEWGGEGRARPSEVANFGRDGGLRTKIRIVGNDEEDRRQREERRKAQREAKRAAERARLARLGY